MQAVGGNTESIWSQDSSSSLDVTKRKTVLLMATDYTGHRKTVAFVSNINRLNHIHEEDS